ncbi:hypothetical protein Sjap_019083 [Stephania japonica]|uniref:chorismate mutase n=1 Tax=Stephania japonica TaxID=461633 RepID=A0AAP0F710_9MAGN
MASTRSRLLFLSSIISSLYLYMFVAGDSDSANTLSLDAIRDSLIRQEDTIVFCDDGNYANTAQCDLQCLQALSRRIHYGKFVAEVKFRDSPEEYSTAIHAQDGDTLMKLLTFKNVEEMVKRRVEKKAMVFGQEVTLNNVGDNETYKIDPSIVSRLYDEWVMPLTKLVQVKYLLRRLD